MEGVGPAIGAIGFDDTGAFLGPNAATRGQWPIRVSFVYLPKGRWKASGFLQPIVVVNDTCKSMFLETGAQPKYAAIP
jgi:hypothetical protein